MIRSQSLAVRLVVPVLATTLVLYLTVFGSIVFEARRRALAEAEARARETATRCVTEVAATIDRVFQVPRTLAAELTALRAAGTPSRAGVNQMLQAVLAAEPELLAVYTLWEPDAFDGRDAEFVGQEGHDASGRFIPYWNRGSGALRLEPLVNYETEGAGDYYLVPRRTGRDAWIEPYLYPVAGRQVLMTSLVCPIRSADAFAGIVAVDIDLCELTSLVGGIRPAGDGYAILVSAGDMVVGHPVAERIGGPLPADDDAGKVLAAARAAGSAPLAREGYSAVLRAPVDFVAVPVPARGVEERWWLVVAVPRASVIAGANWQVVQMMIAGGVLAGLLAVVLGLTARSLARDLRLVSSAVHAGAGQTAAAVRQLAAQGNALSAGAQEQAAAIEQTGSSLERLLEAAGQAKLNARTAAATAAGTRAEAEGGAEEMQRMQDSLAGSREAADRVARIIKTIDEIAFQTNLLALNAAVEAARAGEHGAGFAVVADEVRGLSKRAAAATRESGELIARSQATSRAAEETGAAVAERFARIVGRSRELDGLIADLATGAAEQADSVAGVSQAVAQISTVTEDNAASAAETAASSTELSAQADSARELADRLVGLVEGERGRPEARA